MILFAALDWHTFFFMLFALIACLFAIGVLFSNNIVRMAFYLTLSLGACAGLFFLAGAQFVGSMQLMIYVGGTMVLLVFGVMLTAQTPFVSMRTPSGEWVLAIIVGAALLVLLVGAALNVESWRAPRTADPGIDVPVHTATALGAGLAGVRVDALDPNVDAETRAGMSGYMLPFVIVSIHLLVVLIGAAYMARTRARKRASHDVVAGSN